MRGKSRRSIPIVMGTIIVEVGPGAPSVVDLRNLPGWTLPEAGSVGADYVEVHVPVLDAAGANSIDDVFYERGTAPTVAAVGSTTGNPGSPSCEAGGIRYVCQCRQGSHELQLQTETDTLWVQIRSIRLIPSVG